MVFTTSWADNGNTYATCDHIQQYVGGDIGHDIVRTAFLAYRIYTQGRSQPHSPGWARVPLSSFFPQIWIKFSYFSSNCSHFLPHFDPPGGQVAHPGRPWLRHCLYDCYTAEAPGSFKEPGKPRARPVRPSTGIWLRAIIGCVAVVKSRSRVLCGSLMTRISSDMN